MPGLAERNKVAHIGLRESPWNYVDFPISMTHRNDEVDQKCDGYATCSLSLTLTSCLPSVGLKPLQGHFGKQTRLNLL